jgi:hypothetical protein
MWELLELVPARLERYAPKAAIEYPAGWAPDPGFFRAGLDYSTMEILPGEVEKITDWYTRVCGEVPPHVELLGTLRPSLLKGYRNRFENTVRVMPKQMMPWLLLQYESIRGHEPGIREAVQLCRGFGVAKQIAMNAVAWAMLYGGHGCIATVSKAAGDVFDKEW